MCATTAFIRSTSVGQRTRTPLFYSDSIIVNARIKRHFKIQSGQFGYCQTSLNTEKTQFQPICFCNCRGFTKLCSNLASCIKIARKIRFFVVGFFVGFHFKVLKAKKLTFPQVNMHCKRYHWIHKWQKLTAQLNNPSTSNNSLYKIRFRQPQDSDAFILFRFGLISALQKQHMYSC